MTELEKKMEKKIKALERLVEALGDVWDGYDPHGDVALAEDAVENVERGEDV